MDEQIVNELISEMNRSNFTFILGAGASAGSGIRQGSDTARQWLTHLMAMATPPQTTSSLRKLYDVIESDGLESITSERISDIFNACELSEIYNSERTPYCDWMAIAKILWSGIGRSYFEIASYLGRARPDILLDVLYKEMQGKVASSGYLLLAEILQTQLPYAKHNIVITTNFDDLILQAVYKRFNEGNLSPVVISHSALANQVSKIDISKQPVLFKVHNDLFFNPKNTEYEVTHYSNEVEGALTTLIRNRRLLVIGYSGAKDNLMEYLIRFRDPLEIYWAYYDEEPRTEKYQALKETRPHNVKAFKSGDFDGFMKYLSENLVSRFRHQDVETGAASSDRVDEETSEETEASTLRLTAREELKLLKFKKEDSYNGERKSKK